MGARFGTFQDLLNEARATQRHVADRLRKVILTLHPNAVEVVRLGDRAATYGFGPGKMTEGYAYIMFQHRWVNLGFYRGADLADPSGLLEGTGTKLRHVKIYDVATADEPALHELILAAYRERGRALGVL